jgi:hypothetical protein
LVLSRNDVDSSLQCRSSELHSGREFPGFLERKEIEYSVDRRPWRFGDGYMKVEPGNNIDLIAGLLLFGFGALGMYLALDYPFGSALRMGPGYFPRVLAGILMAFGAFVLVRGLSSPSKMKGRWGWKPLAFLTVSLLLFGWIMDHFGLIPALAVMFVVAALGGHEFKWKEVAILTVVMSSFAVGVFVYGLGLPYPLIQMQGF